jgi:hypothetical protein
MGYQEQKQAWQRRLIESLHGSLEAPVEPGLSEGRVDFDGGVRESAHVPGDPMQEHNDLLLDVLQSHTGGGAIDFWPMAPAKSPPAADPGEEPDQGEDWRKGDG